MSLLERLSVDDERLNTVLYDYWMRKRKPDGWNLVQKRRNYKDLLRITDLANVPIQDTSCLDVGCGSGRLAGFLRKQGIKRYLGVDIYEPSLRMAKGINPDEEFILADFLTFDTNERFDYAFLSGVLSTNLDSSNHAFVRAMVRKIWHLTTVGCAINFLTNDDPGLPYNPDLRFYSISEMEKLCREAVPKASVEHYQCPDIYQADIYIFRPPTINDQGLTF